MRDENSCVINTVSVNVAIESERVFASLGVSFQILSDGCIAERFKRCTAEDDVLVTGLKLVELCLCARIVTLRLPLARCRGRRDDIDTAVFALTAAVKSEVHCSAMSQPLRVGTLDFARPVAVDAHGGSLVVAPLVHGSLDARAHGGLRRVEDVTLAEGLGGDARLHVAGEILGGLAIGFSDVRQGQKAELVISHTIDFTHLATLESRPNEPSFEVDTRVVVRIQRIGCVLARAGWFVLDGNLATGGGYVGDAQYGDDVSSACTQRNTHFTHLPPAPQFTGIPAEFIAKVRRALHFATGRLNQKLGVNKSVVESGES